MRNRRFIVLLLATSVLVNIHSGHTDTTSELQTALRKCIDDHSAGTQEYKDCIIAAWAAYKAQQSKDALKADSSSTGFQIIDGLPAILIPTATPVVVHFEILIPETPDSLELVLLSDDNNPPAPDFGIKVGSDADGSDGWSIGFDTESYGEFSGVLVAYPHFPGHDPESDGGLLVIYIESSGHIIPTLTEWGMIIFCTLLFAWMAWVLVRRRKQFVQSC